MCGAPVGASRKGGCSKKIVGSALIGEQRNAFGFFHVINPTCPIDARIVNTDTRRCQRVTRPAGRFVELTPTIFSRYAHLEDGRLFLRLRRVFLQRIYFLSILLLHVEH